MIIAAFNPKGGVGKTTTAVNVADRPRRDSGRSVLLVDLEADLNASISLGVRPARRAPSIAELLLRQQRPADAVREVAGIDEPASDHRVAGAGADGRRPAQRRGNRSGGSPTSSSRWPRSSTSIVLDAPSGYSLLALSVPIAADAPDRADPRRVPVARIAGAVSRAGIAICTRRAGARRASRGILLTMVDYRRQATREIVDIIRAAQPARRVPHGDPAGSARRRSALARHAARRRTRRVARAAAPTSSSPRELLNARRASARADRTSSCAPAATAALGWSHSAHVRH